ncbi:MAG: hypothetical protein H7066_00495, partial [Cytophagaceae bacterium]|nr:hypothetical protein [Gemmatimonadaceae bacterium]
MRLVRLARRAAALGLLFIVGAGAALPPVAPVADAAMRRDAAAVKAL